MTQNRQKRKHESEVLLHRTREKHRLSRLNVKYNPNKPNSTGHILKLNKKFKCITPKFGKVTINLPKRMNFGDDINETVDTINKIHQQLVYGDYSEIYIDQRNIECISPDAALVLLAEINRCLQYSGSRRIKGNYPVEEKVAILLKEIGFYKFLNIAPPETGNNKPDRIYIKICSGNKSDGQIADNFISKFEKVIKFDPISRKRLYESLIECMDNVHAHAYLENRHSDDLLGEWWMAGFCDPGTGQVAFVFWDQGVGIPTTLKEKLSLRIRGYIEWSEAKMIQKAVNEGITRRDSTRHGNGLPSLKCFIDESSPDGFLRVISKHGDYMYCKNHKARSNDLSSPINGSLIVWTINPDQNIVSPDGIIDLSKENYQLRLEI